MDNKLFNSDAMLVMEEMIAKNIEVDLVVTDPPYKVTTRGGYTSAGGMMLNDKTRKGKIFDENTITIDKWLPKLYQVLKETGHCYIMCNNKNLYPFLKAIDKTDFRLIKTMVWIKDNKIMSQAYMSQFEFILFLRKGKFKKINNCGTSDVLSFPNKKTKGKDGKALHSTEKPISLMEVLIDNSSDVGDIVLDPFCGIGSTCIASKNLNRKYIGIELDKIYYDICLDRLK